MKVQAHEEEVKRNFEDEEDYEDHQFISTAFLNPKPTGGKIKVVDGGDSQLEEETSERKH